MAAELPYQTWQRVTGKSWSEASKGGFTNGSAEANLALQSKLNSGWNPYAAPAPAPAPAAAPPPSVPDPGQGTTSFLNQFQQTVADALDPVKLRESAASLVSSLTPATPPPTPLNRQQLRQQYFEQNGITDLESQLNDLKAQEDEEIAAQRNRTQSEEGRTVATNVISGRVSEVQRQEAERLDVIGRAKTRITNELQTRYTIVQTMMEDANLDYQDAVKAYDDQWNRNMQVTQFVYQQAQQKIENAAKEADLALREQDSARANLNIYVDLITKGGLNLANASGDQKLLINRLELQAGLAPGTMESLSAAQNAFKIYSTVNRVDPNGNQYLDVIYVDGSGAMKVENKYLGKAAVSSSGTSAADKQAAADQKVKDNFFSALRDPGVLVASTASQEDDYRAQGKPFIRREELISRLSTQFGSQIPQQDISKAVYQYYLG